MRALLTILACLLVGGCWGSDERFFGPGDWARLNLAGEFAVETSEADDDAPRSVVIKQLPDGLVEIAPQGRDRRSAEALRLGFVSIPGGSGQFYLAVDRTEPGKSDGDLYVIAKVTANALELYFPDCAGTPAIAGMVRDSALGGEACTFETRDALFEAARIAERFLTTPQIVTVSPFTKFQKADPESGAVLLDE